MITSGRTGRARCPAPQGFLGHLIARRVTRRRRCRRSGKPDPGFGGGGGSPEGDRRRRRVRPWGPIFSRSEARGGSDPPAHAGATGGREGLVVSLSRRRWDAAGSPAAHAGHVAQRRSRCLGQDSRCTRARAPDAFRTDDGAQLPAIYDRQQPLGDIEAARREGGQLEERFGGVRLEAMPRNRPPSSMLQRVGIRASANVLPVWPPSLLQRLPLLAGDGRPIRRRWPESNAPDDRPGAAPVAAFTAKGPDKPGRSSGSTGIRTWPSSYDHAASVGQANGTAGRAQPDHHHGGPRCDVAHADMTATLTVGEVRRPARHFVVATADRVHRAAAAKRGRPWSRPPGSANALGTMTSTGVPVRLLSCASLTT